LDDLFATHDALAVAELIRARKLGAREVLDATMASLRKANEELNALLPTVPPWPACGAPAW
jgi:amidase